jgi:hypothetical protein
MQDAHDEDSIRSDAVEHHVFAALHSPQCQTNRITGTPQQRNFGKIANMDSAPLIEVSPEGTA